MPADLDPELEQAARHALGRLVDTIVVDEPDFPVPQPDAVPTTRARHRRGPGRTVVWAAVAGVAAVVAAVTFVVTRPADRDGVSTEPPSPTPSAPTTTDSPPDTTTTSETTGTTTTATTGPPESGTPDTDTSRTAAYLGPLDPATSSVPLDRLADLTSVTTAAGEVVSLQVAAAGERMAMQVIGSPDAPLGRFAQGVDGTFLDLAQWWMVSTVDAQHLVWGVAGGDIASVTVYTTDGRAVSGTTVPVDAPELDAVVFAVLLPEGALIEGMSGNLADGAVRLAGDDVAASLVYKRQHGPSQREYTAFVPVVTH